MSQRRLLEISEYLCLGLIVAGSVAATVTQQVVYVAVPLTLSMAFNLANRRRFNSSAHSSHLQPQIEQLQVNVDDFADRLSQLQTTIDNNHNRQLPQVESGEQDYYQTVDNKIEEPLQNYNSEINQFSQQFPDIDDRLSEVEISIELITQTIKKQAEELNNLHYLAANFLDINDRITVIDSKFLEIKQTIEDLSQSSQNNDHSPYQSLEKFGILTEFNHPVNINNNREIENNETVSMDYEQTIPMLEYDQLIPDSLTSDTQVNKLLFVGTLRGHTSKVLSVAFSPDGKLIASGSQDKTIKIWNLLTQQYRTLAGHQDAAWHGSLNSVVFSPDGKLLASGSDDKTIRLWDVETGNKITTLTGHQEKIYSVAFSPDGKLLASGSKDKTVKIWSLEHRKEIYSFKGHTNEVLCVVFSSDSELLATCSDGDDGKIKILQLNKNKVKNLKFSSDSFIGGINTLAFSPNGRILASGDKNKTIKLWDVETSQEIKTLSGHYDQICSLAFSPDGKILASGSKDMDVKLWSVDSELEMTTVKCGEDTIYSVAFSPDGRVLAAGSGDKTITLFPCQN